jgi:hypothetical protein
LKRWANHEGYDNPHDEPNPVPDVEDVVGTIQQGTPDISNLTVPQEGIPENLGILHVYQQVHMMTQ